MNIFTRFFIIILFGSSLASATGFLMPNEAFKPYTKVNDNMQIKAGIELGKSIYVYEDKVKIELKNADGLTISNIKKPIAIKHEDSMIYSQSPLFLVTLKKDSGVSGIKNIHLILSYQGCSSAGLCYEPYKKDFSLQIDTSKIGGSLAKQVVKNEPSKTEEISKEQSIAQTISSGNIFVIILTFLGFGLLLSLTPCIFPMIPIISGLIVSQGEGLTTKRAFFLSVVYVLAMAVAYTIAGVLAGLFGSNLQATLQNPYVIYTFSAIFVALALSMFGFYELKLPDSLVSKVSSNNNRSGVVGVAIMGFLSALIVGPCVAAPLAGALVYIGQTGDALLGGIALFAMSIGMGLPLIIVGVSAGKFMPKPGAWMTMVSAIFGIVMLGVAIWMLDKVVTPQITTLLFSMLGIGSAIYFGLFEKDIYMFRKFVAVVLFIYSLALFMGVMAGGYSMTKPLGFLVSKGRIKDANTVKPLDFKVVRTPKELDTLLDRYKGKKILIDFSAKWCTSCKEFEELTFANPDVRNLLKKFVLIRVDVTDNTPQEQAIDKRYGIFGPPDIIFIDEKGKVLKSKTIVGFMEADKFIKHIKEI